jgi:DnaK suppressor protein
MEGRVAKESGLNNKQIAAFEAKLERRRAELRVAAGEVTREGRELENESAVDVADRAVSSATKEFLFHQAQECHQLLHMVEAALERIGDCSFGECLACGGLIDVKRLEAVPWTELCVACQEKRERGEISGADVSGNDAHMLTARMNL